METSVKAKGIVAKLDATAQYVLLATIFLLPLATVPATWLPLAMVKTAVLAIGVLISLILWAVARLNEHKVEFPNSNILWGALLLVVGYFLAAVLSQNVIQGLIGFGFERDTVLTTLTFVGLLAVVALTTRTIRNFLRLQQAALAAFLLIGIFQIVRVTFGADAILPNLFSSDPTATLLGSWNDLAVFSGLALLMALSGLALFSAKKLIQGLHYLVLLIALFLLALVNLTAIWATLALATFLLAVYIFSDASYDRDSGKFRPRLPWKRLLPSVGVLAISVVFLVAGTTLGQKISDTFNIAYVDVRPSWEGTIAVGAGVYQNNLLVGVGPNSFEKAWIEHKPVAVNETNFWNTDFEHGVGLIPTAFITGGVVVGLLWILFLVAFVHLGFRLLARRIAQPAHMYMAVSSYVGAAYLWALAVVYVPQTVMLAYTFALTGMVIAAAQIAGVIRTREVQAEKSYASGLALTGVVLSIALVSFGAFVLHAERMNTGIMLSRAIAAANTGDLDRAEYIANRASLLGSDVRSEQLKTNIGISRIGNLLSEEEGNVEAQRAQFQNELSKTITSAQAAVSLGEDDYRNWLLLADIYARLVPLGVEGAYDSAVGAYNEAQSRNTKSPIVFVNLSRLALLEGDLETARAHAEEALALKGNYTDAYYLLSQIAVQEGNVNEAIQTTEAAVLLRPGNAGLLFQLGVLQYSLGAYEKVVPVLERAIAINSRYANALYFLGLSYDKLGNAEGALASFERVASLNPENAEVQAIVTALTEGKSAFDVLGEAASALPTQQTPPVSEVQ